MEILVATHNKNKKKEIQDIFGKEFVIKSLDDYNLNDEIDENGTTFQENACIKARYCFEKTGKPSLGDDSGLVISALDGRPGIFSARYSGDMDFKNNVAKVLSEMKEVKDEDRDAYFITVLCLVDDSGEHYFEGRIHGKILNEVRGENGFGYDPIFVPNGYEVSFSQMDEEEKNKISHRAIAIKKFLDFINS